MKKLKFTLLELIVVIAIIAILMTLLSPLLTGANETARRTACQNNLRNIGIGIRTYAGDNYGFFPPSAGATSTAGKTAGHAAQHDTTPALSALGGANLTGARSSRVNSDTMHLGYTALHNVNILREPKIFKCPSRNIHDISDDVYNSNLKSGTGNNYGNDQDHTELSYPYFVNDSGSNLASTSIERTTLQESNYGGSTSIARDRIINHGGYNFGNVLYGDGHVEEKTIEGGASGANSWLTYYNKTGLTSHVVSTNVVAYAVTTGQKAFEGNTSGLGADGNISWYNNILATHQIDKLATHGGNP